MQDFLGSCNCRFAVTKTETQIQGLETSYFWTCQWLSSTVYVLIPVSVKMTSFNSRNEWFCRFEWNSYKLCATYLSTCIKRFIQVSWFFAEKNISHFSLNVVSDITEDGWWHPLLYLPAVWAACTAILTLFATTYFRTWSDSTIPEICSCTPFLIARSLKNCFSRLPLSNAVFILGMDWCLVIFCFLLIESLRTPRNKESSGGHETSWHPKARNEIKWQYISVSWMPN